MGEVIYGYYDNNVWVCCEANDPKCERVEIDVEEYNGLQKALRIVRDRALQQIDKSKADEHGYRFLNGEYKAYDNSKKDMKAWMISKSTPHSLKIPICDVVTLIEKDLKDYYHFTGLPQFSDDKEKESFFRKSRAMTGIDMIKAVEQKKSNAFEEEDFYCENSFFGRRVRRLVDGIGTAIAFEIEKITCDYANGVYRVTYWATECI